MSQGLVRNAQAAVPKRKELYRELTAYQFTLEEQNLPEYVFRRKLKERKAEIDAELEPLRSKEWQAYEQCNAEFRKHVF